MAAGPFVWRDGAVCPRTAKPATFSAAVSNITADKIATAQTVLTEKGDLSKALTFTCLVGAASQFVTRTGEIHRQAFDDALKNLTRGTIIHGQRLLNDPGASEPLYVLSASAGWFVSEQGRFDAAAFNEALSRLTPADVARRRAPDTDAEKSLCLLLRERAPQRPVSSPAHRRTSTDRNGRQVEADFLSFANETVRVKRVADGKTFEISLQQLCDADQQYVRTVSVPRPIVKSASEDMVVDEVHLGLDLGECQDSPLAVTPPKVRPTTNAHRFLFLYVTAHFPRSDTWDLAQFQVENTVSSASAQQPSDVAGDSPRPSTMRTWTDASSQY